MTRIKKRRSGKKRTSDRRKVSVGRRGGRAMQKTAADKERKTTEKDELGKEPVLRSTPASAVKKTGKTRSAGARRVAAAKNIAAPSKGKSLIEKAPAPNAEAGEAKKAKGFAPWNKNKFKRKDRTPAANHAQDKKHAAINKRKQSVAGKKAVPASKIKGSGKGRKKP